MKKSFIFFLATSIFAFFSFCFTFYGYFLAGGAKFSDSSKINFLDKGETQWFDRKGKLVILIVDSLRYDYLSSSGQDLAGDRNKFHQLIDASNKSPENFVFVKIRADAPTMTADRIPCIATGNIPAKTGLLQAFKASALIEDSFVRQLKLHGKKSYYFGDPLWTGFFPSDQWTESTGIPDFTLRDNGADDKTFEYINGKLDENKFDLLFTHLITVDHMAHAYSLGDARVGAQIKVVDDFIMNVFKKIDDETTVVIFGDHGAKFSGVHGGASEDEITTAFLAYNKKGFQKYNEKDLTEIMRSVKEASSPVKQQDITPTLSMLMGLPLPFSNLGQIIPDIYPVINSKEECAFETKLAHDNYLNSLQILNYIKRFQEEIHLFEQNDMDEVNKLSQQIGSLYEQVTSGNCNKAADLVIKAQSFSEMAYKLTRGAGTFDMLIIYQSYALLVLVVLSYVLITQYLYRYGANENDIKFFENGFNFKSYLKKLGIILAVTLFASGVTLYYEGKVVHCFAAILICAAIWLCGILSIPLFAKKILRQDFQQAKNPSESPLPLVNHHKETSQTQEERSEAVEVNSNIVADGIVIPAQSKEDDERLVVFGDRSQAFSSQLFFMFQSPWITVSAIFIVSYCLYCVHLGIFKINTYQYIEPASPFFVLAALTYKISQIFPQKAKEIMIFSTISCVFLLIHGITLSSDKIRICLGIILVFDSVWTQTTHITKKLGAPTIFAVAFLTCFAFLASYHLINDSDNYLFQIVLPRLVWAVLVVLLILTGFLRKRIQLAKKSLQLCLFLYLILLQKPNQIISFALLFVALNGVNHAFKNAKPSNYLYPLCMAFVCQFGLHVLGHTDFHVPSQFGQAFIGLHDFNPVLSPLMISLDIMTTYILGLMSLTNYNNPSWKGAEKAKGVEAEEVIIPREQRKMIKKRNIILFVFMYSIIYFGASAKLYFWRYLFLAEAQEKVFMDFGILTVVSVCGLAIF